jgi:hypothetical protein
MRSLGPVPALKWGLDHFPLAGIAFIISGMGMFGLAVEHACAQA